MLLTARSILRSVDPMSDGSQEFKQPGIAPAPFTFESLNPGANAAMAAAATTGQEKTPVVDMEWLKNVVAAPYWLISILQRDPNWEITEEQKQRLAIIFEPVFVKYIEPNLAGYMPELMCAYVFAQVTVDRARTVKDLRDEREKAEKAKAQHEAK